MPEDYRAARREAIKRAADVLIAAIRAVAPTAEAARSWRTRQNSDDSVSITTRDMGAVMSESATTSNPLGRRHPVYARGPRSEWTWVYQNERRPERTHAAERAMYAATDDAGDALLNAYLERIAIDNPYFERR